MLMHCSEELLLDKAGIYRPCFFCCKLQSVFHCLTLSLQFLRFEELVLAALHECGTALRFVPLPLRRDHEVQDIARLLHPGWM